MGNKKTLKPHSFKVFSIFGGDEEDRTLYLLNAIQALSQVSYAPGFSADSSAEIIIAQNFRSVHSFLKFLFGTYKLTHDDESLVRTKTFEIAGTGGKSYDLVAGTDVHSEIKKAHAFCPCGN